MPHFPALELGPRFGPLFTTLMEPPRKKKGRKTLRNVTCFCKSSLEKSRSPDLHRLQRSRSVGCRRSASWHAPSASDDRKGTTRNKWQRDCKKQHIKWSGFLPYLKVRSSCHVTATIIVVFILFIFFIFFSTSSWCVNQRSRLLLLSLGHLRGLILHLSGSCQTAVHLNATAPPAASNSESSDIPSLAHLDLGT